MDLPSKTEGLAALMAPDTKDLPATQEVFKSTADFVAEVIENTPEETKISDIESVKNLLLEKYSSKPAGELTRDFVLNRGAQSEKLTKLGPDVLLDLISLGMLPSRLSKSLGVSYATLDLYLERHCDPVSLDRAMALAADMLVDEGREQLEMCDETSKLGIMKASEIAKNNLMIAKSLSSKYAEKKAPDIQVNTQILNADGEKKEGWLRMWEPELEELDPLPEYKAVKQVENDVLNNADLQDGEFKLGAD